MFNFKMIFAVLFIFFTLNCLSAEKNVILECKNGKLRVQSSSKCRHFELDNPYRYVIDFVDLNDIDLNQKCDIKYKHKSQRLVISTDFPIKDLKYVTDKCDVSFLINKDIKTTTIVQKKIELVISPKIPPIVKITPKLPDVKKNSIEIKEKTKTENITKNNVLLKKTKNDIVVSIDAGHGGRDPGTTYKGMKEKDINLSIAEKLKKILEHRGYKTVMTRNVDEYVELKKRVKKSRQAKANIMISIHVDYSDDRRANGATVYTISNAFWSHKVKKGVFKQESFLPQDIHKIESTEISDIFMIMLKERSDKVSLKLSKKIQKYLIKSNVSKNARTRLSEFTVLHSTDIPTVLVETGYISNENDLKKLKNYQFGVDFSKSIADAIDELFVENEL